MSAWIVSKNHIDYLVGAYMRFNNYHAALDRYCGEGATADDVGRLLWTENVKSVDYRYKDSDHSAEFEAAQAYTFSHSSTPFNPAVLIKQIHCYEYQTSEHPEWWHDNDNKARRFVCDLLNYASRVIDGYDEAPWGI